MIYQLPALCSLLQFSSYGTLLSHLTRERCAHKRNVTSERKAYNNITGANFFLWLQALLFILVERIQPM